MTEQEMRELDVWLAENVFGIEVEYGTDGPYERETGMSVWFYTQLPQLFAAVKREIEQREWRWGGESHPDGWYWFRIWKEEATDDPLQVSVTMLGKRYERSEELAGCLAFKAAVEAMDDKNAESSLGDNA